MHEQLNLWDFDGQTYDRDRDQVRLSRQMIVVRDLMLDGVWRTVSDIAETTGEPPQSVSARLRDLRKPRFGGYEITRRNITGGIWVYRLEIK